jgi:hypothetical protein
VLEAVGSYESLSPCLGVTSSSIPLFRWVDFRESSDIIKSELSESMVVVALGLLLEKPGDDTVLALNGYAEK